MREAIKKPGIFGNNFDIFVLTDSFFRPTPTNIDDKVDLEVLGYGHEELDRIFTMESLFCLSFSAMGLLPSLAAILSFSLGFLVSVCEVLIVDPPESGRLFGAGSLQLSWRNSWLYQ